MTWMWYSCVQCPLSEDLICCDVFEQIQRGLPAGELLWFRLRLNLPNGLLFKLMQSPRYSLKSDKTRTGGYLVGSKLLKDFGKGILLTHNARQPASRRLQLCCMTYPGENLLQTKAHIKTWTQNHEQRPGHKQRHKHRHTFETNHKLSCMNLHDLH